MCSLRRDAICLVISGLALAASFAGIKPYGFDPVWVTIVLCGIPIVIGAAIALVTEFDIKADLLVSMALIASVAIGEYFAAGEIAFIMQIGSLLEELTVARARAGIERLVKLTPRTARIVTNGREKIVSADEVHIGDIVRVFPGEVIPVDGEVKTGRSTVNESVMTGESMPVDKAEGDELFSGTLNMFGSLDMTAVKVGEDSSVNRLVRLVQSADAGKAKIVGIADRMATWIVVGALTCAAVSWFVTGEIVRSVTVLVVFCPCALVLATPAAVMAAIGNASKHGFLVREGDALERLAQVTEVALDKTGTLTYGKPIVAAVSADGNVCTQSELYSYAAAVESRSEHPLGKAVASCYKKEISQEITSADDFETIPGRGVRAVVDGKAVIAGKRALLEENGIVLPVDGAAQKYIGEGCTPIYVAVAGKYAGMLAMSDTLRDNATATIAGIRAAGAEPILLTGDHEEAAMHISSQLGITHVHYNCTPEEKLNIIDNMQQKDARVCMIGDGVNDAPALKKAFAGIAMGGIGSDIAADAADIVLVSDDIGELPHLLLLSKRMTRTIKHGIAFSLTLNFIAIILAVLGKLSPVAGALLHNAGSVLVIINSALLLKWREGK